MKAADTSPLICTVTHIRCRSARSRARSFQGALQAQTSSPWEVHCFFVANDTQTAASGLSCTLRCRYVKSTKQLCQGLTNVLNPKQQGSHNCRNDRRCPAIDLQNDPFQSLIAYHQHHTGLSGRQSKLLKYHCQHTSCNPCVHTCQMATGRKMSQMRRNREVCLRTHDSKPSQQRYSQSHRSIGCQHHMGLDLAQESVARLCIMQALIAASAMR